MANEQKGFELDFSSPQHCSIALEMAASGIREKLATATPEQLAKILKDEKQAVEDRIVDVMVSLLCLGEACDIDLDQAFERRCKVETEDCTADCCSDEDCSDEDGCTSDCCSE